MKYKICNTTYRVNNYLIESSNEYNWTKIIKIIGSNEDIDIIIKEIQDKNLGNIYKIQEI